MIPEEINNLICKDLYTGKIMRKAGSLDLFFITEKEDRKDYIRDQALQLIMTDWGYTTFSFFGKMSKTWTQILKQYEKQIFGFHADMSSPISQQDEFDTYVEDIYHALCSTGITPHETYLVYDDKELFQIVLESLRVKLIRRQMLRNNVTTLKADNSVGTRK